MQNTLSRQNTINTGRWNKKQHKLFLQGFKKHGKNWKLIQLNVPNRSLSQVRSHAQKYFIRRERSQYDSCQSQLEDIELSIFNKKINQYQDQQKQIDITGIDHFLKTENFVDQKPQITLENDQKNILKRDLNINSNVNLKQHYSPVNKVQFPPQLQNYTIYNSFYHSMILHYYDTIIAGKYLQLVDLPNDQKNAILSSLKI